MNKKHISLLFLVCFIPFVGYFFNPNIAFGDSYAFLTQVCGIESLQSDLGSGLFTNFILPLIPCNIFLIKLILFFLFFVSVVCFGLFAERFVGKDNGWRIAFFGVTLSPLWLFEALKFENDIFGWALAFIGLYLVSFCLDRNDLNWHLKPILSFIGVLVLVFASFIYFPVLLLLIASGLIFIFPLIISIPLILLFFEQIQRYFYASLGGNNLVSEELIGYGIPFVALMIPALFDVPKKLKLPTYFLFAIGFFKAKFMLFAVPFMGFGIFELEKKFSKHKWFPNLIFIGIIFSCIYAFMAFTSMPTPQTLEQIDQAIILSNNLNIPLYNDWEYGWWITYNGYHTNYRAGYPQPDYNNLEKPFIAISKSQDLKGLGCEERQTLPTTWICLNKN